MSEKTHCPTCEDKGRIQCPCCSGSGGTIINFFPFGIGKAYTCSYCGGSGTVPCPSCSVSRVIETVENIKTNLFSRIVFG
jgi:DnaJ-class molecular chaperone